MLFKISIPSSSSILLTVFENINWFCGELLPVIIIAFPLYIANVILWSKSKPFKSLNKTVVPTTIGGGFNLFNISRANEISEVNAFSSKATLKKAVQESLTEIIF